MSGVERWERWELRVYRSLPYPLLAASLLASVLDARVPRSHLLWAAVLSLLAAGWVWLPRASPGSGLAAAKFVGLLGLTTGMVLLSGWYGIFAFCGYLFAYFLLVGRWRYAGVVANAAVVVLSYGIPHSARTTVSYLILFVIVAALAGTISHFAWAGSEQAARHRQLIAELETTNRRLEAALDENAGLHAQLLSQAREAGVLDERARMAREIHDTIAQGLAGIVTQLEAGGERRVETARELARESLAEARRSVAGLGPQRLERVRLPDAIDEAAQEWSVATGVAVTVETTGEPRTLVADVELALFRVCQESLANVAKHAGASRVGITLSYLDDVVTLDVRDDGVGFAPETVPPSTAVSGYGIGGMRQRVLRVAGAFAVESAPGEGTAISANVPAIPVEVR